MQDRDIKRLRLGLGLSQERFARLLGVSLQTVRRWEEGRARPLPIISVRLEELRRQAGGFPGPRGGAPVDRKSKAAEAGVEVGLGGLFKGLGSLFDLVSRMAQEGQEEYTRSGQVEAAGGKVKGVYGFSVRMGLEGKPVIEQFGNIRATEDGPAVAEVREPMVDILDEGESLVVIAELPGVEPQDVQVEVSGDILEISAGGRDRNYSKEVLLPAPVDAASMKSTYRNGILTVSLAKKLEGGTSSHGPG